MKRIFILLVVFCMLLFIGCCRNTSRSLKSYVICLGSKCDTIICDKIVYDRRVVWFYLNSKTIAVYNGEFSFKELK